MQYINVRKPCSNQSISSWDSANLVIINILCLRQYFENNAHNFLCTPDIEFSIIPIWVFSPLMENQILYNRSYRFLKFFLLLFLVIRKNLKENVILIGSLFIISKYLNSFDTWAIQVVPDIIEVITPFLKAEIFSYLSNVE